MGITKMDDPKATSGTNYGRLVLFAYVILWDLEPAHRIERALLIVRHSVLWREGGDVRRRVLRRCYYTSPNAAGRPRAWLRIHQIQAALDPGLAEAIEGLSRGERVAYVLQRLEGLTAEKTIAELRRMRLPVPDAVIGHAVDSVDAATELDPDEQRRAITALDVTTVPVSPRWSPRRARPRLAALLAGVLAVALASVVLGWPEKKASLAVETRVDAHLASLGIWPSRGDRLHDHALLGRARDAWEGVPENPKEDGDDYGPVKLYGLRAVPHPRPEPGTLKVLFAGTVGSRRSVVLADGDLYALYSEYSAASKEDRGGSLTVQTDPPGMSGASPLALTPPGSAGGTRLAYLLPPAADRVEIATLEDAQPAWRSVTARDGVLTMPERDGPACHRTLFRVFVEHDDPGAGVFTGLDNPLTMTQVSWSPPPTEPPDKADIDTRLVRDVICNDESFPVSYTRVIDEVSVESFWHGTLPEAHHQGALASLLIRYGWEPDNLPQVLRPVKQETQTLLIDRPSGKPGTAQIVKHATDDGEGGLPEDTTYAIASWHAPSHRWYMVAGGTPAIVRMRAWGKHNKKVEGNTLIIRGPKTHEFYGPEWHTSVDAETKSGEPGTLP
ncbi:hypothetical protein Airi01_074490 [Actinoallomurus iriomotensis]|uniref:Uncharacterized protein n=1 Tax=Actinoallomurus iriomotensis TaxID=478107 RepID=A0A9W6RS58_9ACTN|nr:hypothetical protein Airi01_074490 [Actinoallomurus iriomotensis]